MKKILLFIILLSVYSFGQQNKLVRQNELSDSLNTLRGLIGTGGVALPDSTVFTSELTGSLNTIRAITDSLAEDIANTVGNADSLGGIPASAYLTKDSAQTWAETQVLVMNMVKDSLGYRTLESFGAVGDGITNDSAAVVNALKSGYPIKGISGRTYAVSSAAQMVLIGYNIDLSSTGSEPFTISFTQNVSGFAFWGTLKTSALLLADSLEIGSKKLVFSDVSNVDTGDVILLLGETGDYWDVLDTSLHASKYDLHLVDHLDGDTVFTKVGAWDAYDGNSNSNSSTVYIYAPITVRMKNVVFDYPNSSISDNITGITIAGSKNDLIEDIEINNARQTGMILWYSYDSKIIRPKVNHSDYVGTGYGIYLAGTFNCLIEDGYFNECRSATDGGTLVSRNNIYRNNTSTMSKTIVASRGFGMHAQTQNCLIENNTVYNSYYGIVTGGEGHTIRGNRLFNNVASSILLAQAKNAIVDGNIADIFYEFPDYSTSLMPAYFCELRTDFVSDENSSINIINNISNVSYNTFIYVETNLYHLNVSNNIMKHFTSSSYLINAPSTDTVWYANIRNNIYNGRPNYGTNLSNNIVFLDSYTEFYSVLSKTASISGNLILDGSFTTNGIDIDSLANITSVFNSSEDATAASYITNGTCEGVYAGGLAPNVTSAGTITPSEETGYSGSGQGFTSTVFAGSGNVNFYTDTEITAGTAYKLSFYAKTLSGGTLQKMIIYINGNFWSSAFHPSAAFQKFEYTFTPTTTIAVSGLTLRFGNYTLPDTPAVFVIDNVELRPLVYETSMTNMIIDSTSQFEEIDSLPYVTTRVKMGNVGGELVVMDAARNETTLSPHPSEFDGRWMYLSKNNEEYTVVDWEKFIKAMEEFTGRKFLYKGSLESIKKEMR